MRTELGSSHVEVQQCALSSEVGEGLGEGLARRKWRWKLMQTWSRRNRRRRRRRTTALIKSNNPHLAGGEKQFFVLVTISMSGFPSHLVFCLPLLMSSEPSDSPSPVSVPSRWWRRRRRRYRRSLDATRTWSFPTGVPHKI